MIISICILLAISLVIGIYLTSLYTSYTRCGVSLLTRAAAPIIGLGTIIAIILILIASFGSCIWWCVRNPMVLMRPPWEFIKDLYNLIAASFISTLFIIVSKFKINIDCYKSPFWKWAVTELNRYRSGRECPSLYNIGRLYVRDPHSHPMRSCWRFSSTHPLMILKGKS